MSPSQQKSPIIAFVLAILPVTGPFGVHSFYLRSKSTIPHIIIDVVMAVLALIAAFSSSCNGDRNCYIPLGVILLFILVLIFLACYLISIIEGITIFAQMLKQSKSPTPTPIPRESLLTAVFVAIAIPIVTIVVASQLHQSFYGRRYTASFFDLDWIFLSPGLIVLALIIAIISGSVVYLLRNTRHPLKTINLIYLVICLAYGTTILLGWIARFFHIF